MAAVRASLHGPVRGCNAAYREWFSDGIETEKPVIDGRWHRCADGAYLLFVAFDGQQCGVPHADSVL
jgi:hypothetical protein